MTVENVLYKMLTENTGKSFLDSGTDYGRHWEENQKKTLNDFKSENQVTWNDDYYTISLFHYLCRGVHLDNLCIEFNSHFVPAEAWDSDVYGISRRGEKWLQDHDFKIGKSYNSYNSDRALSQTIQITWLTCDNTNYMLLQIHQGCDVRGGYTDAQLFYVPDYDDGVFLEDVFGVITTRTGKKILIDNTYDGVTLRDENNNEISVKKDDKIELYLSTN